MAGAPLLRPAFPLPDSVLERARSVRLLLLDVDGVLTDGRVILGGEDEHKTFDIKDGHGMKMLQRSGVALGIVTGRTSRAVERRAAELGIEHLHQGCDDKLSVCRGLLTDLGLAAEQAAYVGDDVVDLPVLLHVGLSIAVHDAHPLVKQHAHWVTPSAGGHGAARETCELILHAQGKYEAALRAYLGASNRLASAHA
jgi:3-deoxy-D-manno-octulosonate 8-phosphate phosphatase (KDO 8-P phosphatase)